MVNVPAPDASAPTISIATPANGATHTQGRVVNASYICTDPDGPADVASCSGPVASGSPIDTSTTGAHSFTVSASDHAGNNSSQTVNYTVAPSGGDGGTPTPTVNTSGSPSTKANGATVLVNPGITVSCAPAGDPCTADETATAQAPASLAKAKNQEDRDRPRALHDSPPARRSSSTPKAP